MAQILLMIGAGLTAIWGVAHLFPTKSVVAGFGDISVDNRRIITMEWVVEGVALLFIGVLVAAVTLTDYTSPVAHTVYFTCAGAMIALALVSLATGFKIHFLPFRLCPVIFGVSAILFLIGPMV